MTFHELKGQNRAVKILKSGVHTGRIAHAYMFCGPEGVGKKKAALIFAQLLNCKSPQEGEPCDKCIACQKIKHYTHPDLLEIEPEGTSIKIAQIRDLQERAYYKCYEGKFKVIIINDAHLMTMEAANCLLKILEEPPLGTIFILLVQDIAKLPITIVSRCQYIPFNYLAQEVLEEILAETGVEDKTILALSQGSAGKALEFIKEQEYYSIINDANNIIESLPAAGYKEILAYAERLEKNRDMMEVTLETMLNILRDKLISLITGKESVISNLVGERISIPICLKFIQEINKCFYYLKNKCNARLALDVLFINLRSIYSTERGDSP